MRSLSAGFRWFEKHAVRPVFRRLIPRRSGSAGHAWAGDPRDQLLVALLRSEMRRGGSTHASATSRPAEDLDGLVRTMLATPLPPPDGAGREAA